MFVSYADALAMFNRARSKSAGKPINAHLRMLMQPDGCLMVINYDTPLCLITPENTIRFIMSEALLCKRAHSLSTHIRLLSPIGLRRKAKKLYAVMSPLVQETYEYFDGIELHMKDGKCLNPRPSLSERVCPDKRREWLQHLRVFKRQLALLNKLGVIHTVVSTAGSTWVSPNRVVDVLYHAIRSGKVTTDDVQLLASHLKYISYVAYNNPSADDFVDRICKMIAGDMSIELRNRFNVFKEV